MAPWATPRAKCLPITSKGQLLIVIISSVMLAFSVCREAQAVAKGLVLEEGEEIPPAMRKKQILKRIREWEKFEANCNMLKVLKSEKHTP